MIERVFAAIVLAACAVLLLRLLIGERRRWRFDSAVRRSVQRVRRVGASWRRWRKERRDTAHAAEVANQAIQRARGKGDWDGNVYTPKSFRKPPRDKNKMH